MGMEPFAGAEPSRAPASRWTAWLLWLGLFLVYTSNGRAIGSGDIVPATFLPLAMIRGDGPFLDRFDSILRTSEGRLPGYATESRGHSVSRYPLGAAILAVPFELPQVAALDLVEPGWDRDPTRLRRECTRMGKNAAAAITALSAVVLWSLLRGLGCGRVALLAVLAVALGTDDWAVASQGLWQHGPAELCLGIGMWLLMPRREGRSGLGSCPIPPPPLSGSAGVEGHPGRLPTLSFLHKGGGQERQSNGQSAMRRDGESGESASRGKLALAGVASSMLVACRPIDLVFAAVIALWVFRNYARRDRIWFFVPVIVLASALCGYNLWFFDTLSGGYAYIETQHSWAHGLKGTWTSPLMQGAAGTLLSPSHGLFVYSPWLVLALGLLPITGGRLGRASLVRVLVLGLVPYFILLAKYSCWWGGHCFGARFWIDANPLFAIILGFGLDAAISRSRPLVGAFAAAIGLSVATQALGFLCYPSSWHGTPTSADRHHERLWDWRDSELTRCLREGVRPRVW